MAPLADDLAATIAGFRPVGSAQRRLQREWARMASVGEALWRQARPAHFTASALPVSEEGPSVCLVHHPRIGQWVQPGGHFEPDDVSVVAAAGRELVEETGLAAEIDPRPLLLSRHPAPCGVGKWHLDLALLARVSQRRGVADPGHRLGWFPPDGLPADVAPGVAVLVAEAMARIRGNGSPTGR